MRRNMLLGSLVALLLAAPSLADQPPMVKPGVFDPDRTRTVSAQWVSQQGLPDSGKSDHALVLIKATDTSTYSAAGATVDGVEGLPAFTTYGFDSRLDSYCGAGAPRFNLYTEQGTFHFIGGCANGEVVGTKTDRRGRGWEQVEFDPVEDAFPPIPPDATIAYLEIVVDEDTRPAPSGAVILDNIRVGDIVIGKPGAAK